MHLGAPGAFGSDALIGWENTNAEVVSMERALAEEQQESVQRTRASVPSCGKCFCAMDCLGGERGAGKREREREREKREKRGRPSNARAFLKDLRQASQLCLALGLGARHFCFCFIEANACRGERMESFQGMVESAHTAWEIMVESAGEGSACVCARASEKQDRSDRGRFCRRYRRCGDVARCLLQPERRKKISQERGED